MCKLNKSHFNRELKNKIIRACRQAMKTKSVAHVENRKGHAIIAVRYIKVGNRYMFELLGKDNKNILGDTTNTLLDFDNIFKVLNNFEESVNFAYFINYYFAYPFEISNNKPSLNYRDKF